MFELDFHRKLALQGLALISIMLLVSRSQTAMGWVAAQSPAIHFLFVFVAATTLLSYTLLFTLFILGGTSQQVQYLIPMMFVVGLVVYIVSTAP